MVKTHLSEWRALVAMSLVPDWRKRGDEKDQGQSNLLLTHISPFFAANHISHLECFHVFMLYVVITCSYIVLDKKVKKNKEFQTTLGLKGSSALLNSKQEVLDVFYIIIYTLSYHIYIQLLSCSTIPSIIATVPFPMPHHCCRLLN